MPTTTTAPTTRALRQRPLHRASPMLALALLLTSLAFMPPATVAHAAPTTFIVNRTADDKTDALCAPLPSGCTLREAINASNASDPGPNAANTITFATDGTITFAGGLPTRNVTIDATVGAHAITITGGGAIFQINSSTTLGLSSITIANNENDRGAIINNGGTVTITGSTFSHNSSHHFSCGAISNGGTLNITNSTFTGNYAKFGSGAICNFGTLTITGSTFSDNHAFFDTGAIDNYGTLNISDSTFTGNGTNFDGGAISNGGTLNITNSTFSGNNAAANGGAITNRGATTNGGGGTLTIRGSTFSGNTASGSQYPAAGNGGAIHNAGTGTLTLALSLVAGNTAPHSGPDISGTVTVDGGGNVIGITDGSTGLTNGSNRTGTAAAPLTPSLAPLGTYGGTVQTFALLPGSPAIDLAPCPSGVSTDARGVARPQGTNCDAGSYEVHTFTAGTPTGNGQSATVTTAFASPVGLTVANPNNEPVEGGKVTFTLPPGASGASATFGTAPGCTVTGSTTMAVCTIGPGGMVTSPTFTANRIPGTFTIVATANGVPSMVFTETVRAITVQSLTVTAPTGPGSGNTGTGTAPILRAGVTLPLTTISTDTSGAQGSISGLTYTGYNPNVISVNTSGMVTALSAGTTTVTITAPNGVSTTLTITVNDGSGTGLMAPAPQPMAKPNGVVGGTAAPGATIGPQPIRKAEGTGSTGSTGSGVQPQAVRLPTATPQPQPGRH